MNDSSRFKVFKNRSESVVKTFNLTTKFFILLPYCPGQELKRYPKCATR